MGIGRFKASVCARGLQMPHTGQEWDTDSEKAGGAFIPAGPRALGVGSEAKEELQIAWLTVSGESGPRSN